MRYKPYSSNYYDYRYLTYENRKDKIIEGAFHHQTSGYVIHHLFSDELPYDASHKFEKFLGTGHGGTRAYLSIPNLMAGLEFALKANIHQAYDYLYHNGIKIASYFG